ncbi:hypothetical protein HMPREF9151_00796 [Hoylesella saccharolytica F0055]|uniref:Uncharacterized protein n=1 Tax=Hoylesella saccharolytica F0055 TaxID=1127699 RepID=L1NGP5_9BACT|nr:hypothetical protein HMPREF9151_00796 [Hoylesella saccharolytica F0055]
MLSRYTDITYKNYAFESQKHSFLYCSNIKLFGALATKAIH